MDHDVSHAPRRDERSARTRFVLVEPRSGGNVGAAARALKNLAFHRIVLVDPSCDPQGTEAQRMAVDARDVLEAAERVRGLDAALSGAQLVCGMTARTGKHRQPHLPVQELAEQLCGRATIDELAVVFGREDRGLTDIELDRCTHLVYLPASVDYSSYNLAQAVLLVAWELRRSAARPAVRDAAGSAAPHGEREQMYAHLERALRRIGFLNRDGAEVVMRRVRRLLGRAEATREEVKLLRGVARQVSWVADRAGLADDGPSGSAR